MTICKMVKKVMFSIRHKIKIIIYISIKKNVSV